MYTPYMYTICTLLTCTLQVISTAMLFKLHDPKLALADKLSALSGKNSWALNADRHAATIGVDGTTDRVESNFGGADNVWHTFRLMAPEHVSGFVVENRSKHFAISTDYIKHRRSKKSGIVYTSIVYTSIVYISMKVYTSI